VRADDRAGHVDRGVELALDPHRPGLPVSRLVGTG
jgi:hypothetical protein